MRPPKTLRGLLTQLTKAASKLVLETPKTFAEGLWRFFALSAVTGVMVSAVLLWRYPRVVQQIALGGAIEEQLILDIFRSRPHIQEEVIQLIANYIARYHPTRFAIVNWTTQTGITEVWANESTKGWPTATDGVMSRNMREAVGYMIFDQCWSGELKRGVSHRHVNDPHRHETLDAKPWLVCGMSDSYDLWGYLLVHWDDREPSEEALEELSSLARHLERLLFE